MDYITLYHVSLENKGSIFMFSPQIPKHVAIGEDEHTPRICCATSITNCIQAMAEFPFVRKDIHENIKEIYVYTATVPVDDVSQAETPDAWMTGELWLLKPTMFHRYRTYTVNRQMHFEGTCYSRFIFNCREDEFYEEENFSPIVDRVVAPVIYGDLSSFSILALDYDYAIWMDMRSEIPNKEGE